MRTENRKTGNEGTEKRGASHPGEGAREREGSGVGGASGVSGARKTADSPISAAMGCGSGGADLVWSPIMESVWAGRGK